MKKSVKTGAAVRNLAVIFLAGCLWAVSGGSILFGQDLGAGERPGYLLALSLEGRWVRPDGGYVLVLEKVERDGGLIASYFNPKKINVHESFWNFAKEKVFVFVELRDAGYPGSKYALYYDDKYDSLIGVYFSAGAQRQYEIYFTRSK